MKEKDFRNQVYWLTFLFSLLVVWVHSYNGELYLGQTAQGEAVYRLEHMIGDRLGQIAVPAFFMLSAYLFYRGFTWEKLWTKWNSRIRSILVPYIVWNTIYYLGYVIASRIPGLTDVVGKGIIPLRLDTAVDAIINYRYNYVFWYLHQLILLIALAPLLYAVLRKTRTGIMFLVLLYAGIWLNLSLPFLNLDALFYYSAAAYAAIHWRHATEAGWSRQRGLLGVLCILTGILLYEAADYWNLVGALVTGRFLAPVGIWLCLPVHLLPPVRPFMTRNFFLYATHFAFVRLINKTGAKLLPPGAWIPFALYLLMPVLVLAISTGIGAILRKLTPRLWYLLNGGR